jgi:hypothetical protein
MPVYRSV